MHLTRRKVLAGAAALGFVPSAALADTHAGTVPDIATLVDDVSQDRLRETVVRLSAFPTRSTLHPGFPAVEYWVQEAFVANGAAASEVSRQPYRLPTGKIRHNIICGDPMDARGVLLLGAHMDSTSEDPMRLAPGANDNATGIAAMLEAWRILSPLQLDRAIVCVAFSGEEQGLLGAAACAAQARHEDWPLQLMLNLDMLGYRPPRPDDPMVIEYDQGNAVASNDAQARDYALRAAEMARAHTSLTTTHTDIWGSDYMPFEAQGFAAIGLYDGAVDSPHYHSSTDTVARVDFDRVEHATRLVVATLASAAGVAA